MPIMRKDDVGAIIFDLTPEEKAVQELHNRVTDLEAKVEELKKLVKSPKAKTSK